MKCRNILAALMVLLVLAALTVVYTYPMIRYMPSRLHNPGDPLLISWTLAWNLHALTTDPMSLWHANIFYPYEYTLAFSEVLLGPTLFAAPVWLFSQNPILLHNASFLLGVLLSAFAAYLLAFHFTRSHLASLIPAVAFAFCPFKLARLGHLQIQHGMWIPLAILMVALYFKKLNEDERGRWVCMIIGALCVVLQGVSNGYYLLFMAPCLALFQLFMGCNTKPSRRSYVVGECMAFWACAALLLWPLFSPYLLVQQELGLGRNFEETEFFSASLSNYFAYNSKNLWFGEGTSGFSHVDGNMSPGIVLVACALVPLVMSLFRRVVNLDWKPTVRAVKRWFSPYSLKAALLDVLILLLCVNLYTIYFGDGFTLEARGRTVEWMGVAVRSTEPTRPLLILLVCLAMRAWVVGFRLRPFEHLALSPRGMFWVVLLFSLCMSLGPEVDSFGQKMKGLYAIFYYYMPGYSGLRVPARFAIMVMLSLGMIGAMNIALLMKRIRNPIARCALPCCVVALVAAEYLSHPTGLRFWTHPAPVYEWLRDAPRGPVIEFPLRRDRSELFRDVKYVFNSTTHWQKIFNGYSGYSPPAYEPTIQALRSFPDETAQRVLSYLDIAYIVVHRPKDEVLEACKQELELLEQFGSDYVFRLKEKIPFRPLATEPKKMDRLRWRVTRTNPEGNRPKEVLYDGLTDKRWHPLENQQAGMSIEIALDRLTRVSGIGLHMGDFPGDFPRGVRVKGSRGGLWRELDVHVDPVDYIDQVFKKPREAVYVITTLAETVDGLRIELTESDPSSSFTIYEIELYEGIELEAALHEE